jgi:DNA-3-methyladenine glycosylase II
MGCELFGIEYNELMSALATPKELSRAASYLSEHDPQLAPIIKRAGLADLKPHQDYYGALVNSIIGQQLSVKAAASIKQRFKDLFSGRLPAPEQILEKSVEDLRGVGFSNAKAHYVHDLAQHIIDGKVVFDKLDKQSNEEIIAELTDVKGIGEWTVHMFLMFCMGRLDILPVGDLGIRNGVRALYGFEDLPTPQQIIEIAERNQWHPYESVASWYIWHSLDNAPAG